MRLTRVTEADTCRMYVLPRLPNTNIGGRKTYQMEDDKTSIIIDETTRFERMVEEKVVKTLEETRKTITLTSTTGKFAKNEVSIAYKGVKPDATIGVWEVKRLLADLKAENPTKAGE